MSKRNAIVVLGLVAGGALGGAALLRAHGSSKEVRIVATSARARVRKCGCQGSRTQTDALGVTSDNVPEPGGLAERSAWLAQARARDGEIVQLDAGDLLFPARDPADHERAEWRRKAELLVEAYGLLGVKAYVPGERDLALGRKAFEEILSRARFQVIAANLVDAGTRKPVFPAHAVVDAGGARIGIVGVYDPPGRNDVKLELLAREQLAWLDPVPLVRAEIAELRRSGCDLVVLLAHQGEEQTRLLVKSVAGLDLSQKNDNVDIAFCAHAEIPSLARQRFEGTTLVCAAHWKGGDLDYARIRMLPGARGSCDPAAVALARRSRDEHIEDWKKLEAERKSTTDEGALRMLERKLEHERELASYDDQAIPREPRHEATIESVTLDARKLKDGQDSALLAAIEKFKADMGSLVLDPALVASLEAPVHSREGILLGYRTAEECVTCHTKQAEVWRASSHSRAWATLESAGNHKDPDCVRCHSVGFREPGGFAEVGRSVRGKLDFKNVQCESCHGPRASHPDTRGAWKMPTLETCQKCHDHEHDPSFDQRRVSEALKGAKVCVRD